MHQGELLRAYLRINDITIESFMAKVSKSRQTVYNWFNVEQFDRDIFNRIVQKGGIPVDIFMKTKFDKYETNNATDMKHENDLLKKEIEFLKRENTLLREELTHHRGFKVEPSSKQRLG